MTGATLTVTEIFPNSGLKFFYFEATTDSSALLDFSDYSSIKLVQAWTDAGITAETVAGVTDAGDVTFTSTDTAIVGYAIAQD